MLLQQAKRVHGFTLFDWLTREGEEGAKKHMQSVWDLFLDGTIQPLTGDLHCIASLGWHQLFAGLWAVSDKRECVHSSVHMSLAFLMDFSKHCFKSSSSLSLPLA